MFGIKKDQLVRNLVKLSVSLCGYCGNSRCDCKYMPDDSNGHSETTGCPETRMAADLINAMGVQEFFALAKRAGISINDDSDYNTIKTSDLRTTFADVRMKKIQEGVQNCATKKNKRSSKA
jgi:hypothetical protein